ncbi:MAG: hypothetical protein R2751_09350 [Bacteroidales bacterium]
MKISKTLQRDILLLHVVREEAEQTQKLEELKSAAEKLATTYGKHARITLWWSEAFSMPSAKRPKK